jgi:hypothetical protein
VLQPLLLASPTTPAEKVLQSLLLPTPATPAEVLQSARHPGELALHRGTATPAKELLQPLLLAPLATPAEKVLQPARHPGELALHRGAVNLVQRPVATELRLQHQWVWCMWFDRAVSKCKRLSLPSHAWTSADANLSCN